MYKNYFTHLVIITTLLFTNLLVAYNSDISSEFLTDNSADANTNLALLDDATLSGSSTDGRGTLDAILYDPSIDDYFITTDWNEYGVGRYENLGRPDADNGFFWRVDWSTPKLINYVTFGGSYSNQPQPNAMWRISYLNNNVWVTLEEGQGGWIDNGIYEWDGTEESPITANALRVQVYSDGNNDLVSILLRGRGGLSNNYNDTNAPTKATLIQYLPVADGLSITEVESQSINKMQIFPNPSSGDVSISFTFFIGIKEIEIYDLSGRLVKFINGDNLNTEDHQIYIRGLSDGIYNLNVIDNSGFRHQKKLVVKQ
jgi:hypothetical protein